LCTQIAQYGFELSRHGVADGARDHDAARRRLGLQSGRDVHAVAVEVVTLDNEIAQMNADAKHHRLGIGQTRVQLGGCLLELNRSAQGVDRAREFG